MSCNGILNTRTAALGIKAESTPGTPETITASDCGITIYNANFAPEVVSYTRDPYRGSFSKLASTVGRKTGTITFEVDVMGSGDVTTEPAWATALEACGFETTAVDSITIGTVTGGPFEGGETINFGTSAAVGRVAGDVSSSPLTYVLVSGTPQSGEAVTGAISGATASTSSTTSANKGFEWLPNSCGGAVTVKLFQDGIQNTLSGAVGNVSWSGTTSDGSPARMAFTFQGAWVSTGDEAIPSGISYEDVTPVAFNAVNFQILGNTLTSSGAFTNLSMDLGNTISVRESANATDGVLGYVVTDRDPSGSIDPELVLAATIDFYGDLRAGNTGRMSFGVGSTAGNTINFSAPVAQYTNVAGGDRNGFLVAGLDFTLVTNPDETDNELQVVMI